MKEISLREYQQMAVDGIRLAFREGHKRVVLCGPCGFGKSVVAAYMTKASADRGKHTALVVDRRELVKQLSRTLVDYGIDHGVLMAKHERYAPDEVVQVCSAQTLEARGSFPKMKLIIADEAHSIREQFKKLMEANPDLYCIGTTATPLTKGMGKIYTKVVNVCTTDWLIDNGYLIRPVVYAAKAASMKGAKVVAGEWAEKEIEARGRVIIGDIVQEWIDKTTQHFGGPVKTIVFSATVDHGAELCKAFNERGYRFEQISYKDRDDERREELLTEYRKPDSKIVGLVACEVFSRGFDVPDVLCGVDARPLRKSLTTHIQKFGRIMRPAPGKTQALWLCHAQNYLRFQEDMDKIFAEGIHELDEGKLDDKLRQSPEDRTYEPSKCVCGRILPRLALVCPSCGAKKLRNPVEEVTGQMVLINGKARPATGELAYLGKPDETWAQLAFMALKKKGTLGDAQRWAQAKFWSFYGKPFQGRVERTALMPPSPELQARIQYDNIRYAKRRRAV